MQQYLVAYYVKNDERVISGARSDETDFQLGSFRYLLPVSKDVFDFVVENYIRKRLSFSVNTKSLTLDSIKVEDRYMADVKGIIYGQLRSQVLGDVDFNSLHQLQIVNIKLNKYDIYLHDGNIDSITINDDLPESEQVLALIEEFKTLFTALKPTFNNYNKFVKLKNEFDVLELEPSIIDFVNNNAEVLNIENVLANL